MAKAATREKTNAQGNGTSNSVLRQPAEVEFRKELEALRAADKDPRPEGWQLSPKAVRTYILGGKAGGVEIRPKYLGNQRVVEIAISTLATDRALLLTGEPGTAKCVKGDTLLVDLRTGERVTIEELYRRRAGVVPSLGDDYRLRPQTPVDFLDNGVRPCYRIRTRLGREIEVTLNHPFLTMDGWKPLAELQVGHHIALPRALPNFGTGEMSDARVKLLAYLIAEGCLTQNLPYFCNTNPKIKEDFTEAAGAAFPGVSAHWLPDGRSCGVSHGRKGPRVNPCTTWLRELGLMGTNSGTKFIPEVVFTLPRPKIALFLNRLYAGDGCLRRRRSTGQATVDYCTKSYRLARDVQHLLLRFGFNARIRHLASGHYRLYIQRNSEVLRFLREIGIFGRDQEEAVLAHLASEQRNEKPNCDLIPAKVWGGIDRAARTAGYAGANALVKRVRGDRYKGGCPKKRQGVSRARLLRLAQATDDPHLLRLAQSDVYWDAITEITPIGEHRVYDLSMPEVHNFVANDIIVHNSWLSEHLTAAICGDSLQVVQGTAGTTEEQIRYSWNYALLLAEGPSPKALVTSPFYRCMVAGKIVRFEEISRVPSEIQDSLITILSEKMMAVPELGFHIQAKRGFNVIATANSRDRGVNDMSAALTRRFNKVVLPVPSDLDTEVQIVRKRVAEIGSNLKLPAPPPAEEAVRKVVQIFQELRRGQTVDGKQKLKPPSGVLSTAEAISLFGNSMALAGHFGDGKVGDRDIAAGLHGVIVKEDERDMACWVEYLENIMKKRGAEWRELYTACKELA
jgi:intein/homing endonuclease/MoxR-like ATPase